VGFTYPPLGVDEAGSFSTAAAGAVPQDLKDDSQKIERTPRDGASRPLITNTGDELASTASNFRRAARA
jgi:hypothetical protein